ncbi:MAG: hypothetical protein JWM10_585 [Myxococcaceae bacterium]|nr:hypothetical protein [Myxococcaceae bacterium]
MRVLGALVCAGWLAATAPGCATSMRQTLDETAAVFHDDLRWGRLPAAETAVDTEMRAAFQAHHRGWGESVQVIDVEVESLRSTNDRGSARLRVAWVHAGDSTDVKQSLVEEQWESRAGSWRLRGETVIAGDPGLFGTPAPAPDRRSASR